MEIQFNKVVIPCLHNILQDVKDQEKTQEIRLPDDLPDIGRVIMSWGQVLLRGKEWRGDAVGLNCGVMAWVLYEPEQGGAPQCIDLWLPIQMNWNIEKADHDGMITFHPLLRSIDARSVSARKLVVRAGISVRATACIPGEISVLTPDSLPEDIQVLNDEYMTRIPKEMGEKTFVSEESLELPSDMPKPASLISYSVYPAVTEQKILGDKLIFRGTNGLHLVYLSVDGQVCSWDFSIPYSQYSQLDREYGVDTESEITAVVTVLELDLEGDGQIHWKIGVSAQYTIYDRETLSVASDAYSNSCEVTTRVEALQFPSVLSTNAVTVSPEVKVDLAISECAEAMFYPQHPKICVDDGQVQIELNGQFQVVGYDSGGRFCSSSKRWEYVYSLDAHPTVKQLAQVLPAGRVVPVFTGEGIELRSQLSMVLTSLAGKGIPMITQMQIGSAKQKDVSRPSLIIKPSEGKSLWEHAKECGSTVDAIRKANALQNNDTQMQMLLIPIE